MFRRRCVYIMSKQRSHILYTAKKQNVQVKQKNWKRERENNSGRSNADSNENWKPLEPLVHLKIPFSIIRLK